MERQTGRQTETDTVVVCLVTRQSAYSEEIKPTCLVGKVIDCSNSAHLDLTAVKVYAFECPGGEGGCFKS